MKTTPRLLNCRDATELPRRLFTDLQMEKILSAQTISVLQKPCSEQEILRRQEIFALLEREDFRNRVKTCLSVLLEAERARDLWRAASIPFDRYHLRAAVLSSYMEACVSLSAFSDGGSLFAEVSGCFSSAERQSLITEMRKDHQRITALLRSMHSALMSFSDKNWITPDEDAVSEFDHIAACVSTLGFSVSSKKTLSTKVDLSLSDAVCRLRSAEVGEMESIFARYENIDFEEPLRYISEIRFLLEICELIGKADRIGVMHCIPRIATEPQYTARELCDVSLLAKKCERIIPNDADFSEQEPFFFLLGANGGGKTTYLRALGINLILFLAGCPVFAKEAMIYPFDLIASHFPMDERFDQMGRLDEELARTTEMLNACENKKAFLLLNETFSGTDDKRGFALLKKTAEQIGAARHFCLFVTHFHEVMEIDYPVLSAEVDSRDENKRTYRIVKSKGNASSFAVDILRKYRLDKDSLMARREGCGN